MEEGETSRRRRGEVQVSSKQQATKEDGMGMVMEELGAEWWDIKRRAKRADQLSR
jgi:hypothetical protein